MEQRDVLNDIYAAIRGTVHQVVEGAGPELLAYRIDPEANTIAWLVWHLTRVQDRFTAVITGSEQVWLTEWAAKFGLPIDPESTGFGHTADEVSQVVASAELLLGYQDAANDKLAAFLAGASAADLGREVDGPRGRTTVAGLLTMLTGDGMQHAGQAAFIQGSAERAGVK